MIHMGFLGHLGGATVRRPFIASRCKVASAQVGVYPIINHPLLMVNVNPPRHLPKNGGS